MEVESVAKAAAAAAEAEGALRATGVPFEAACDLASDSPTGPMDVPSARSPDVSEAPGPSRERDGDSGSGLEGRTVYVVDAHSLIYQVFHALPEMSSPSGQPVGAVYGFIRDVLELITNRKADYLFCAFDHPGPTFRHEIYQPYKEERESMPDDLRPQIASIHRMLAAMGIPSISVARYEADDILATIAHRTEQLGGRCYLVTGDKDCRQLISDRTQMYNIRKQEIFDAAALLADWGIRPEQVVDFQTLWGDKIDNIPGIEGIGKKTASELLQKYGTLEGVLAHAHEVTAKRRRENLQQGGAQALISRQLVQLDRDMPMTIDWESARVGRFQRAELHRLCQEFGFRRLAEQFDALAPDTESRAAWSGDYRPVTSLDELRSLLGQHADRTRVALDLVADASHPRWARLLGVAVAWDPGRAWFLPWDAQLVDGADSTDDLRQLLRPVAENDAVEKIGHDVKAVIVLLRAEEIALRGPLFDTSVADYLLEAGERIHEPGELARRYLRHETASLASLLPGGKAPKDPRDVPPDAWTAWAGERADVALRLVDVLRPRISESNLNALLTGLELPLLEVLADLEFHGIFVDTAVLEKLSQRFGQRLKELEDEIYQSAGSPFNIDSRQQLAQVLFEDLKLPVVKKTKTGPSTDVEVLETLARVHPLPAKVIEYRQLAKLKGTYVDALPKLVHPRTGRVHTTFRQDVAATGRLSSVDPNLQNIPIRTAEGREIRSAFRAGQDGWCLLTADYSQIELRVLAHFSADANLTAAFRDDVDIHAQVASEVYGVPREEVTSEMRRAAKAINFGIIYGQSSYGLAKALEIEPSEAATFIQAYFARYPSVDTFVERTLEECRRNGYIQTLLGRRRAVHGIRDASRRGDSRQRNLPERIAVNTVIQGTAADLIKQAMIHVHRRMRRERLAATMLLQIHDELVFECPRGELACLSDLVTREMALDGILSIPLKVDVVIGDSWAEC